MSLGLLGLIFGALGSNGPRPSAGSAPSYTPTYYIYGF